VRVTLTHDDVDLIDDDLGDGDLAGDYFGGPVLTAAPWPTNAHMVEDLAGAGLYLRPDSVTIDLTTNAAKWWRRWRPDTLVTNDLDPRWPTDHHFDVRCPTLPEGTKTSGFDVACLDLPYVSTGGRTTSTVPDFNRNYGLVDVPRTPDATTQLLCEGLAGAMRLLRIRDVSAAARRNGTRHQGGLCLFKGKNYISSATLQPTILDVINYARAIPGVHFEDWFLHLTKPMAQPKLRGKNKDIESPQGHGRSNCSHLLVFRRTA
jgi:hypothetical protein